MSYVALGTARFDEVVRFYREDLGFAMLSQWDRPSGRGCMLDLGGLRLEILDAGRECLPLLLSPPGDRMHLVVEVADVDAAHRALSIPAPAPTTTSWGARLFQLRDPDGVSVCFMQWLPGARC